MTLGSKRSVTVVAGLSGYGKNTGAIRILLNADLAARFVFDPDPGAPPCPPDLGEFAFRLQVPPARDLWDLSVGLCQGLTAFDPHTLFLGRPEDGLNFFCDFAFEKSLVIPGEKVIVVDEVQKYCSGNFIPQPIRNVATSGRKARLQLIVLTNEPNKLNSTFYAAMSEVICFRLQGEKQKAWAKECGFDPEEVAALDPLQLVARNLDTGGELRGRIKL